MTTKTMAIAAWLVDRFDGPGQWGPSQDASLCVALASGTIRLAAIDGITPVPATPHFGALDGATYAAQLIAALLHEERAIEDCLRSANEALFDERRSARAQAQAAVVAADITPVGAVHIVRAQDCEAWIEDEAGRWTSLFPRAHRPWARQAWTNYLSAHPGLEKDWLSQTVAEDAVWGDPEAWEHQSVGRVPHPRWGVVDLPPDTWRTLLLASDGLGTRSPWNEPDPADPPSGSYISTLLAQIRDPSFTVVDDTTALLVRRRPLRP
jgi:hypothetical protein